jgi:hypothetical protein
MCLLEVPTFPKNFQGVHFPPKPPIFGPGIGISSANKTVNNFSTVYAIFAQITSIGAAWQNTSKIINGTTTILV